MTASKTAPTPPCAGSQALERARAAKWTIAFAQQAIAAGDAAGLAKAAEAGWTPSLGKGGWFACAFEEKSGSSMAWLIENFPLAAMMDPAMQGSDSRDRNSWTLGAMLAAEDFAPGAMGLGKWAASCAASARSAAYFKDSLGRHPMWEMAPTWGGGNADQRWERLALVLSTARQAADPAAWEPCVAFVAARAAPMLARDSTSAGAVRWCEMAAGLACAAIDEGRPLAHFEPLLECLPRDLVAMDSCSIALGKAQGGSAMANLEAWAKLWMGRGRGRGLPSEARRVVGLAALMGSSVEALQEALDRGWVGTMTVSGPYGCENPFLVAWESARLDAEHGRHVDIESRWAKCVDALERSDIPAGRKAELLAQCERRDPTGWSPGEPRGFSFGRAGAASPMALLMAAAPFASMKDACLAAKAEILSKAGFSMRDALNAGVLAKGAKLGAGQRDWVARIVEREELELAAGRGAGRPRSMSL